MGAQHTTSSCTADKEAQRPAAKGRRRKKFFILFSLSKNRIKKMMKKALRRRIFRFCNNTIRVMPRSSGQNITKHGGGKKFRPIRRRKKK
jgi:hypothetical protein